MSAELVGSSAMLLPEDLRAVLMRLASGEALPAIEIMRAGRYLGVVHAQAVGQLMERHSSVAVDFAVAHGQTVWHAPADGLSWQLFDPWPIVRALGLPVCYDLRQADLIAGGQGAPITSIADPTLFGLDAAVVLNLGGICNFTHWPKRNGEIRGGDLGPCNLLIDTAVARLFPGRRFDEDGQLSGGAVADAGAVERLKAAILERIGSTRSLGREQFEPAWCLEQFGRLPGGLTAAQRLASVIAAVAHAIAERLAEREIVAGTTPLIAAGGGARNPRLIDALSKAFHCELKSSQDFGLPVEVREAAAFAVLGALSQDGVPITLPSITGSDTPGVAGVWAQPDFNSV